MELFTTLEDILTTSRPVDKINKFKHFYLAYKHGEVSFDHTHTSCIFDEPSYSGFCNIVLAKDVPRRRKLHSDEDKAILVHAIAHIEYSAIDLALDAAYRFKNLPSEYYDDWISVASDEMRHFQMLEHLLVELGYVYGSFGVSAFLFDISMSTLSFVDRMACVPRYLEASGLDANPQIIKRLKKTDSDFSVKMIDVLDTILNEEVDHVKKGDDWFRYACEKEGVDPTTFFEIVERYLPGASNKKAFVNVAFRKEAGYTCEEIGVISDDPC